jgi:hypothetical protein
MCGEGRAVWGIWEGGMGVRDFGVELNNNNNNNNGPTDSHKTII